MTISRISKVVLLISCLFFVGCAQQPGLQYGLRGNPNAPHQRVQPLEVNQNAMYSMSPSQFAEYQKRVNWATQYNRQLISNDQAAANAAKAWVNNSNNYYQNNGFGRIRSNVTNTLSNEITNAINDSIRGFFD